MQTSTLESQPGQMAKRADFEQIIIVADDLTGACDSGVAFLASGRGVRVVLDCVSSDALELQRLYPESVLSFTTESRHRTEAEATERVAKTLIPFLSEGGRVLYFKKIDSAARGHVGAEVMAALESSHAAIALVTPAFPYAGRTVDCGVLKIHDAAGQHTTVSLRSLFPGVEDPHIGILPAGNEAALAQGLRQAISKGVRVLLCDAQLQEDLERLASVAISQHKPVLWAGSAGLARALAAVIPASDKASFTPSAPTNGRTFLFVGTDHPVTLLQVSHLEAQLIDPALRSIHRVDSQSPEKIRDAFSLAPTAALVLTGGDTAAFVLRALNASSIVLSGEVSPGIPWGTIQGGLADGCTVITKSGGFGAPDALARVFDFCHRRAL